MTPITKTLSRFLLMGAIVGALAMQGNALAQSASPPADQTPVTAIDILLEPDAVMIQHAETANARLRSVFPNGFALDASHRPHITMLQRFVRTADLDKVYAAANKVLATEESDALEAEGIQVLLHPRSAERRCRIVAEPTEDLLSLQQELINAVAPFTVEFGTAAAFASTEEGRDIQPVLIDYVANFVPNGSGKKFNAHSAAWFGQRADS